jgi:hypothetical protein
MCRAILATPCMSKEPARVVESEYTQDLKSCALWIEGSSPSSRTINRKLS